MKRASRPVVVSIDRLVLSGVRYEDRYAVAQGLQDQLTKLFAEPGVADRVGKTGTIPRLRAGEVRTAAPAGPRQIGVAVANGIARGLDR